MSEQEYDWSKMKLDDSRRIEDRLRLVLRKMTGYTPVLPIAGAKIYDWSEFDGQRRMMELERDAAPHIWPIEVIDREELRRRYPKPQGAFKAPAKKTSQLSTAHMPMTRQDRKCVK